MPPLLLDRDDSSTREKSRRVVELLSKYKINRTLENRRTPARLREHHRDYAKVLSCDDGALTRVSCPQLSLNKSKVETIVLEPDVTSHATPFYDRAECILDLLKWD